MIILQICYHYNINSNHTSREEKFQTPMSRDWLSTKESKLTKWIIDLPDYRNFNAQFINQSSEFFRAIRICEVRANLDCTSFVYEYDTLLSRSNTSVSLVNGSSVQHLTVQGSLVRHMHVMTLA